MSISNALAHISYNIDNVVSIETEPANSDEKYNKIIIRDRGPGIKLSDLEYIFNDFVTVSLSHTKRF